jgi:UDP-N-acetylmuramoyl-tripeptide--D-alanyl-D-alanine ligase
MMLFSYYSPIAPYIFIYMLQQVEYRPSSFIKWLNRLPNIHRVMLRQQLILTVKSLALLVIAYGVWLATIFLAIMLTTYGYYHLAILCLTLNPLITIVILVILSFTARILIVNPLEYKIINLAKKKIQSSKATKIAVIGSYGKTTMKTLLETVLLDALNVKATPGNKNVLISHARWVNELDGNEQVLIFEYGEANPGDIYRMAEFSKPNMAIITGLAPAHMENYGSLDSISADFADIWQFMSPENIYTNAESPELNSRLRGKHSYSIDGILGWKVSNINATVEGIEFILSKKTEKLHLRSGLIGLHQVGPLCAVAIIAKRLGLSNEQIEYGIAKTKPFEHRMQPYRLSGAWIIDDTYNGNLEGAKAGLRLLKELKTQGKKIYVTPGFVEQGDMKQSVHMEFGKEIAKSNPDIVVLMKNSTTEYTLKALVENGYSGNVTTETNPLKFYTNLEHIVANGDIVLMQNDWTDNYN